MSAELEDLRTLRSELLSAREAQRAQMAQFAEREREQQQRAHAQARVAEALEQQSQQQAAAAVALQQGLSNAGGHLVARMQRLQQDVADKCEQVERNARADARRSSGGVTGSGLA